MGDVLPESSNVKPHRIIPVVLAALVIYLSMKLYAQHRHIDVYVSRIAPMPGELGAGLPMEQHKVQPTVAIESPYDNAQDKILSMDEVRLIRSQITWGKRMPAFIDSLTIQSPTRVLARRTTSRVMLEYQLVKEGNQWAVESVQRTEIARGPKEAN